MDRYPSLDAYGAAKRRIFDGAHHAVLDMDDPWVAGLQPALAQRGLSLTLCSTGVPGAGEFGLVHADGATWLSRGTRSGVERCVDVGKLNVVGQHNLRNALVALAACDALGLDLARCAEALVDYRGLAHRCEPVSRHGGVQWVLSLIHI